MKRALAGFAALVLAAELSLGSSNLEPWQLPVSYRWLGGFCVGVGHDAILHGSASDPRVTWATDTSSGQRFELLWPVGYRVEFGPQLQLYDGFRQVGREGDLIIGSCLSDGIGGPWPVDASEVRPPTWQSGDG